MSIPFLRFVLYLILFYVIIMDIAISLILNGNWISLHDVHDKLVLWFYKFIINIFYLLASLSANLFLASLISLYVIFVYLSSAHIVSGLNFSLCPSAHVLSDTSFNVRPYII